MTVNPISFFPRRWLAALFLCGGIVASQTGWSAPSITSVSPTNGPTSGGVSITLTGVEFGTNAAIATVGGRGATVTSWTNNQVICTLPVGQGAGLAVSVIPLGQGLVTATQTFSYNPPTITQLTPAAGATAGGSAITISGSSFGVTGTATLGGAPITVSGWTHTTIFGTVPPGQGVSVPLVVTTGAQSGTNNSFSYNPPIVTGLTPTSGTTAGNTALTLTGINFGTNGTVTLGGVSCTVSNWTQTNVVCMTPVGQGANLPVAIIVSGQPATSPATFSYLPPTITSFAPANGPTAGGTALTILGSNFGTSGTVTLGGTTCIASSWSHNSIICTNPAGEGIGKTLQVTVGAQTASATNKFNYDPPFITSVSPNPGPTAGGVSLTIYGSNFGLDPSVTLDSSSCTRVSHNNTNIVCILPAGQGTVHSLVVTVGTQSSSSFNFNYTAPSITGFIATNTSTAGGSTLVIYGTNFGTSGTVTLAGNACLPIVGGWANSSISVSLPAGQGVNLPLIVNVSGQTATNTGFSYSPPLLASVSPTSGPTTGGTLITLIGANFGLSGSATLGSSGLTPVSWSHTNIVATSPVGQGAGKTVQVVVGGQTSNTRTFDYLPPVITSFSPANGPTAGGTVLTLNGTNFGTSGTVTLGGNTCIVSNWSHVQIVCSTPAGEGRFQTVRVVVEAQTNSAPMTFDYDVPLITAILPSTISTAGSIPLTVVGNNFGTTASVTLDGISCTVSNRTQTNLVVNTPIGQGTNHTLIVAAGGQAGPPFLVNYTAPLITAISATSPTTLGGTPLTILGSNFGTNGTVTLGGANCPFVATNWSHSQVIVTLPAGQGLNRQLVMTVSGQSATNTDFNYSAPLITSVSPASGPTVGLIPITIIGANFGLTGSATLGTDTLSPVSWSHTNIVATLPSGQGVGHLLRVTVSGQASNAKSFDYQAPSITSISPANASTAGGTILTIRGSDFGIAGTVSLGGNVCNLTGTGWGQSNILVTLPAGQGINVPLIVTVAQQSTTNTNFSYDPPAITFLSPTSGGTIGGTIITINGSSFSTSGTVTLGGAACVFDVSSSWSQTNIICKTPAGQGTNLALVVTTSGRNTTNQFFSYNPPTITLLSPSSGPTAGNIPITVVGNNFGLTPKVMVNGIDGTQLSNSHTSVVFTLPAGQGTSNSVVLSVGGQTSSAWLFNYDAPLLTGLNPASGPTAGGTVITLTGSGFGLSGVVTLAGNVCPAQTWTHTNIICRTAGGTGKQQSVLVTVAAQTSNPLFFDYLLPTLSATTTNGQIVLSWPTNASDYTLEYSAQLNSTSAWNQISPPYPQSATNCVLQENLSPTNRFFRLQRN